MTIVCFDKHRKDRKVAAVRHDGVWHEAREVRLLAPATTVYRGRGSRQPIFYFECMFPVRICCTRPGVITVLPAEWPKLEGERRVR